MWALNKTVDASALLSPSKAQILSQIPPPYL